MSAIVPWSAGVQLPALDAISDPGQIAARALQLKPRERQQIAVNLEMGNFEVASVFVWARTMALLRKQLAQLGADFIGELLQRPDIDENTDLTTAVSDTEAISLARDLGMFTPIQTLRLLNSQAVVSHFAGGSQNFPGDVDEGMTSEEAIICLKVCVQGVLGQDNFDTARDFKTFRYKLESETLPIHAQEIVSLANAPYFFVKTAVGILLSSIKTAKGAKFEHASRNSILLFETLWGTLKDPERWQLGQAYATEFNEGNKESVKALHAILVRVQGFDYVPENLRSSTFIKVAASVISAHQGVNNFYNEPAPMRELASLGSSIPSPALAQCMTAALCVKLGNRYGQSHAAVPYADHVLTSISRERWVFYINGRLSQDMVVLQELQFEGPSAQWVQLVSPVALGSSEITDPVLKTLISATNVGNAAQVRSITTRLLRSAIGLSTA